MGDKDKSMNDGQVNSIWHMYVIEMSSIYFNIFSEYISAVAQSQVEFEPEDVHILKDIANIFFITEDQVQIK